jgi:predicted RNA-binding Zn-ribbon protein involved in translation (DUF1610 family)
MVMEVKPLYEIEILCPSCNKKYRAISRYAGYHYHTCPICGDTMAKRSWQSAVIKIEEITHA